MLERPCRKRAVGRPRGGFADLRQERAGGYKNGKPCIGGDAGRWYGRGLSAGGIGMAQYWNEGKRGTVGRAGTRCCRTARPCVEKSWAAGGVGEGGRAD